MDKRIFTGWRARAADHQALKELCLARGETLQARLDKILAAYLRKVLTEKDQDAKLTSR